ncbi:hypothetical protein CYLTODRAFT_31781 [Cylindrobasidium torrendii FP15055 ss-10]|uniref:Uncharacterized protein n=1 Tax=Cylindrobasidium torrendii FP15055 ss-10 TaxID=1314674 RepID=A0A0D7B7K6_9AGAR|nr:hypothetical protein CYLTODRAFT_31781 [Cylindrobasidium torrendii FP15055 ss-10]
MAHTDRLFFVLPKWCIYGAMNEVVRLMRRVYPISPVRSPSMVGYSAVTVLSYPNRACHCSAFYATYLCCSRRVTVRVKKTRRDT